MSEQPTITPEAQKRQEFIDTFISVIESKRNPKTDPGKMKHLTDGFRKVLSGDRTQDRLEFDFYDSQMNIAPSYREEADRVNSAVDTLLKPVEVGPASEWSGRGLSDDEEMRMTEYTTDLADIRLQKIEYRYKDKPTWGISVKRVIVRDWEK